MASPSEESKPLTGFAPPHPTALLSIILFVGVSIYCFPAINDTDVSTELFTNRVFPEILSFQGLLYLRLLFAFVCFVGFISGWLTAHVTLNTPYRPKSKVPRVPFVLGGWKKQFPFTAWSWNILGIHFCLSTYVMYLAENKKEVDPWLLHLTLILWEVAAPVTLLVSAVVKYALWPAQIAKTGGGAVFLTFRALLQHNANVIMAVTEAALMGGLPVRSNHISISVIYGSAYVVFTWVIMTTWHNQGSAFLYFFMDTTLGVENTIALYVLLLVLMVFYGIFCCIESVLAAVGNSFVGHAAVAFALCFLTCRFRD